ncbi:MAG: glycine cleavage system protein R [Candidatus Binatia bacterium]
MTSLVLTVIGRDRPGLVSTLAEKIAAAGGNWEETRMASLAGHFAGMLRVTIPAAQADALAAALEALESQGLRLVIERTEAGAAAAAAGRLLRLELVGQDRPGIVRDISRLLADRGISIEELESECVSGSFSGENLFKAQAHLRLPPQFGTADLRRALEGLADELMVDITLEDAGEQSGAGR